MTAYHRAASPSSSANISHLLLELYGPAMLHNPSCIWREFFLQPIMDYGLFPEKLPSRSSHIFNNIIPKANPNIFRRLVIIYWNASSFADVLSNILHDRLFSDYLCKNFSLYLSVELRPWNRVLDRICHTNLASTWCLVSSHEHMTR